MTKKEFKFSAETGIMTDYYRDTKIAALGILKNNSGIRLDMGCGEHKQKGFIGLDIRPLDGVDIVWDMQSVPWPFPDECCTVIMGSHIIEHIKPQDGVFLSVMDELWRIMQTNGQLALSFPYAGSDGYYQDPTHVNPINHATFQYFDPRYPLWDIYKPKPWLIEVNTWQISGNMEVCLRKMSIEEAEERKGEVLREIRKEDESEKEKEGKNEQT